MKTSKLLLLAAIVLFTKLSFSQDFNFLPDSVENNQQLEYEQFTLSYNEKHEQADWVAYELTADEAQMELDRCNCFKSDTNVTTKSANQQDYSSTGFDRGHLCPAADNNMSENANKESFLFSNMSPQLPDFNRNKWFQLEEWVREMAIAHDTIYVVTGPVFVNNLGKLNDRVTIPGYFYKVILRHDEGKVKMIAFLMPQVGCVGELKDYVVPVNTIETMTGLDFFPVFPSSSENRLESTFHLSAWGLSD